VDGPDDPIELRFAVARLSAEYDLGSRHNNVARRQPYL
jgi:hypothetical protein